MVDLVTSAAEVLADRAEVGAAGDAIFHEPDGLRLIRTGPRAGVDAQLVWSAGFIAPVWTKRTRPWAKTWGCGRAVRWSTACGPGRQRRRRRR
jgi:hypothetical protein